MKPFSWLTLRNVKQVLFTFLRVLLTTIFILLAPIVLLIYGLLLLYRLIVFKLAHHFDPKLGKMITSISSIFGGHDVYENSYTSNIALHVVGKIDRFHLIHGIENMLEENVTAEGAPQYPELMQRIVTKFGYKFWRNLDNFQVDNHVSYLNSEAPDQPVTLQDIRDTIARFGKTPLNPSRSPWHVFVVKNFISSTNPSVQSAIILRLHHVMFDGYSIFNLFGKLADNGPLVLAGPDINQLLGEQNTPRTFFSVLQSAVKLIIMSFRGPYELVGLFMSSDRNNLTKICKRDFKEDMKFHECEPFSLDELKAIKNHYKVSMNTLVTALLVRGLKKFMEKRQVSADKVHMTFPLPIVNHPDKLRNYFTAGIISFDMTHDDRVKLLQDVEQKYYQFRFAFAFGLPQASYFLLRVIGSLPMFLLPRLDDLPFCTTIIHTSFPGPVDVGYFCGFPIVDATVSGSISRKNPIGSLCYSYHGMYKIGLSADASIFTTEEEAAIMGDAIREEFLEFHRKVRENDV